MSCMYTAQGKIICKEKFINERPNEIISTNIRNCDDISSYLSDAISKYPSCLFTSDANKCVFNINCINSNNICQNLYSTLTKNKSLYKNCTTKLDNTDLTKCSFSFNNCAH